MWNVGFIPERTFDPSEAFLLMKMDGAAVLNLGRMDPGGVTAGAKAVLGEHLRAIREPVSIAPNTTVGQATYVNWAARTAFSDPRSRNGTTYPLRLTSSQVSGSQKCLTG